MIGNILVCLLVFVLGVAVGLACLDETLLTYNEVLNRCHCCQGQACSDTYYDSARDLCTFTLTKGTYPPTNRTPCEVVAV